jgi:hypothetical protein
VIPRFVPGHRVLRIVAWVAFWPVAFVASGASLASILFIVGAFVSVVGSRRWTALFGAAAVWTAVASIEQTFLPAHLAVTIAAFAGLAFEWLMRRTSEREDAPLDATLRALEPFALWVTMAGVFSAHGAQAAHLHAMFPRIAQALVVVGVICGALSVVAWRTLRAHLARVYAGTDPTRRVRRIADDVDAARVSDVSPIDAAVVEGATHAAGPYRAGEGRPIARVPADASVLRRAYVARIVSAAGTTILCAAALGLVSPPLVTAAHHPDLSASPATLPSLPGRCRGQHVTLRFVPLAPLRALDIEEIASRYRSTGVADVVVERPLEVNELWIDRGRRQIAGEDIAKDARILYGGRENELVVVVTDRDMFLREVDWRYAFATRNDGVAVVSIARMDPSFPLLAPGTYEPARAECSAPLRARAFRMITRQLVLGLCATGTSDDPRSLRRHSVMSLSDLDAIDEATY